MRQLLAVILLVFAFSSNVQADELDVCSFGYPSFSNIVKRLTPTVVNISTTQTIVNKNPFQDAFPNLPKNSPFEFFFKEFLDDSFGGNAQKETVTSLGSGFIISEDGYIVTNNHVIEKADIIDVKLNDGLVERAKVIGRDPRSDIALLKIESDKKLPFVEFGSSEYADVGDWVIAIGNPFGLGGTVTAGIISARGRNISDGSNTDFIQTDAAINRGNSGGPLFDTDGRLIGINTAIFSTNSGGSIGIGFTIPSDTALPIIEQLKDKGEVVRGWLGVNIQIVTPAMAEALNLKNNQGAYVTSVVSASPAEKAGILADDIIIGFADEAIVDMYDLPRIVAATKIGTQVRVKILRNEQGSFKEKILNAKIAELVEQAEEEQSSEANEPKSEEFLGLKLSNITQELKDKYNANSGVVVVGFVADSLAEISGIRSGDIINKVNQVSVKNFAEFKALVDEQKKLGRRNILLSLARGANTNIIITVNIE